MWGWEVRSVKLQELQVWGPILWTLGPQVGCRGPRAWDGRVVRVWGTSVSGIQHASSTCG